LAIPFLKIGTRKRVTFTVRSQTKQSVQAEHPRFVRDPAGDDVTVDIGFFGLLY
jgi:hypothetical protein